jgi:tellurite resistance protein
MANPQEQEDFIRRVARGAQRGFKEFGVPASVTIAQAILESAWGTSGLSRKANNYFGIKAQRSGSRITFGSIAIGSVDFLTREQVGGGSITVTAPFRKYASIADSFRDHGKFLRENSRYRPCFTHMHEPNEFARALQRAGYATDSHYADSLIGLMRGHNLYRFDKGVHLGRPHEEHPKPKPKPKTKPKPKPHSKPKPKPATAAAQARARLFVAGLQRDLNEHLRRLGSSHQLAVDGRWDPATELAFEQVCRVIGIEPERSVRTFRVIAGATDERTPEELAKAAKEGTAFAKRLRTRFAKTRGVGALRVGGKDLPGKERAAAFIAALQRDLNSHLRRLGSPRVLAVDGVWDPHTQRAFEQVTKILGLAPKRDVRTFRLVGGAVAAPQIVPATKAGSDFARKLKAEFKAERAAAPGPVLGGKSLPGKELAKAYIAGLQRDLNTQLKWLGSTRRLKVDGAWDPATARAFKRICTILGVAPHRDVRTFRIIAGATAERSDEELQRAAGDGAAFAAKLRSFFEVEPAVVVTEHVPKGGSGNGTKRKPKPKEKAGARTFRVQSPEMKGDDVVAFQRVLNERFKRWKIDLRIDEDREYGSETRTAARQVAFGLGIAAADYAHGFTPALRRKIRDPSLRTPAEIARARRRRGWLRAARRRHRGGGVELALGFARKHIGFRESGKNRGAQVDGWNRTSGSPLGSEWCGNFMNACLMAAGFPNQPFLAAVRNIETHAQAQTGGWLWTHSPRPGDLALYTIGGAANHVGMVESVSGSSLITIEGNTRADGEGTASPADGVERRHRQMAAGFPRGFARPPYKR